MDEQQRLEIGDRIEHLRKRSPLTQPKIAERLGIGLRAYQKLEEKGTTHFERCQEIAAIHQEWTERDPEWVHASAAWVWDGRKRPAPAVDFLSALSAISQQNRKDGVGREVPDLEELPNDPTELLKRILQELLFLQIEVAAIPALLQEISDSVKQIGTGRPYGNPTLG